ncbi:MAG: phosphate ABC transporter permease PstA [Planctomycetota bacterium]|jgi:phosphate transport system permease protein|nr:phosphate ABC transporter permease PstA [Planctomycetota bacterium]
MVDEPHPSLSISARWSERLLLPALWGCGLVGMTLPLGIMGYMLWNGIAVLGAEFLLGEPAGMPLGSAGGIGPAFLGSAALAGLALLIAFPLGLGGAVFLTEFGGNTRLGRALQFMIECLAAVPAIVYGLFGYAVFVVLLKWRLSLLSGTLTLALMMYPVILLGSRTALAAIEAHYREAALAMGVSRWYVLRKVLLPLAWPGIVSSAVLSAGHAAGAAAPVLFTACVFFARGAPSLSDPVMTLPTHLYFLVNEAVSFPHAYGTASVLIIAMLSGNACAMLIRRWHADHRK